MKNIIDAELIKEILSKYSNNGFEEAITDTLNNVTPKQRADILEALQQKVSKDFWIKLAVTYLDTISRKNQYTICKQLQIMFNENKLIPKKSAISIFKIFEDKIVSQGLFCTQIAKIFQPMVKFVCKSCKDDKRYRMFADYGYVYYTKNFDELKSAVVELNGLYEKGGSPEAVRCCAYLLTVTQFRLARLIYPKGTVSDYSLSEAYNACFEQADNYDNDYGYYDDDDYDDYDDYDNDDYDDLEFSSISNSHHISNILERITRYDCVEIARIFDPHLYYISAELLREIHTAVIEVSERNRYENETVPIVEKSCLFVITPDN